MGRPVASGRKILLSGSRVVGIGLGACCYEEHNVYSLEHMVQWVNKFNKVGDLSTIQFVCNINRSEAKKVIKDYKSDMKMLRSLVSKCIKKYGDAGKQFYQLSPYILRPSLNMYSRDVKIRNTRINFDPALYDGNYRMVSIEGMYSKGVYKDFLKRHIGAKKIISEDMVFNSRDYASTISFYRADLYMASWGTPWDSISMAVSLDTEISRMVLSELERGLRSGCLALLPYYKDYGFPCLVLLDVACLGVNIT